MIIVTIMNCQGVLISRDSLLANQSTTQKNIFQSRAGKSDDQRRFMLKTNLVPWIAAVANVGGEVAFNKKWSAMVDVWFAPWKISQKHSIKTIALFPEIKYWLKNNFKGSFFDIHLSVAWYNIRYNNSRYQDRNRPLLVGGLGYGYKLPVSDHCAFEFSLGVGMFSTTYDRFYNIPNGALIDSKVTTYWGVDRLGITFVYNLTDI